MTIVLKPSATQAQSLVRLAQLFSELARNPTVRVFKVFSSFVSPETKLQVPQCLSHLNLFADLPHHPVQLTCHPGPFTSLPQPNCCLCPKCLDVLPQFSFVREYPPMYEVSLTALLHLILSRGLNRAFLMLTMSLALCQLLLPSLQGDIICWEDAASLSCMARLPCPHVLIS